MLAAALDTELIRLQCYEGLDVSHAVYEWNYPRQILEIRLLESAHALDRAGRRARAVHRTFLIKRPLLRAIEQTRDAAAGAAHRRDRSRRRGVRGVPARAAVRLPDHDPRARHDPRGRAAGRRHHVEPDARGPRRAEAPLRLLLDRLSRTAADGAADRRRPRCPASPRGSPNRSPRSSRSCGRPSSTRRPACRRRSTGRRRSSRSIATQLDAETVDETLGILLKNQEDIQAVRGERIQAMLNRALAREAPDVPSSAADASPATSCCSAACCARPGSTCITAAWSTRSARSNGSASAAAPMSRRRCAACSCTTTTTSRRFDRAFDLFFRAHRPPAPGLPLFSLGERPRVVAGPLPASPVHAELEGRSTPGSRGSDPRGRRLERRRACRARRISPSSPTLSSNGRGRCCERFHGT